jgi:hypothetical protein
MDQGPFARQLADAAERGADLELVVHDTKRRMPDGVVRELDRPAATATRTAFQCSAPSA